MTWVPVHACSLPTAEQPLRVAEFDQLFTEALAGVRRTGPTVAALELRGGVEVERRTTDLAARETSCCSFFRFDVERSSPDTLTVRITVPPAHVEVLDGLVGRAAAHLR